MVAMVIPALIMLAKTGTLTGVPHLTSQQQCPRSLTGSGV